MDDYLQFLIDALSAPESMRLLKFHSRDELSAMKESFETLQTLLNAYNDQFNSQQSGCFYCHVRAGINNNCIKHKTSKVERAASTTDEMFMDPDENDDVYDSDTSLHELTSSKAKTFLCSESTKSITRSTQTLPVFINKSKSILLNTNMTKDSAKGSYAKNKIPNNDKDSSEDSEDDFFEACEALSNNYRELVSYMPTSVSSTNLVQPKVMPVRPERRQLRNPAVSLFRAHDISESSSWNSFGNKCTGPSTITLTVRKSSSATSRTVTNVSIKIPVNLKLTVPVFELNESESNVTIKADGKRFWTLAE